MNKNLTNDQIKAVVQEAYNVVKSDTGGKNADYIPYLANVSSSLFGISVCLPDGEVIEVGDTGYVFGIESVSKVPTAILVMKQYGADVILQKIGADATGLPFNSIMAILLENDHPSSPLVNAGAISACSMVKPVGDSAGKWKAITDFLGQLCGSPLVLIDELYKSESRYQFQQSFDCLVVEELQPDLRRPRHVARYLYAAVFAGHYTQAAFDLRRYDRQPGRQSRDQDPGIR